jgi:hypothetical protein
VAEAFPSQPVLNPRVFIPGTLYYQSNGKFLFLNGRHRTAVLLGELEAIPLAIQFTEEAPIPLEVLGKFTQRELSPGSILDIPDLPILTEAQLGAVTRTDSPTKFLMLAGVCIPIFFDWLPPDLVAAQLLALIEDEAASWPSSDGPLSLAGLVGIRIHEDWNTAMSNAESDVGALPARKLSPGNPAAVKHGRRGSELLIDRKFIESALLSQETWTSSQMRAVLRHELAHVHDRTRLNNLFGREWHHSWSNSGEKLRQELALMLWEEYYADRKASENEPMEPQRVAEKDSHFADALLCWETLIGHNMGLIPVDRLQRAHELRTAMLRVCQNLGYALGLRASGCICGFSGTVEDLLTRLGWNEHLVTLNSSLAQLFADQAWPQREILPELGYPILKMSEERDRIWTESVLDDLGSGCVYSVTT